MRFYEEKTLWLAMGLNKTKPAILADQNCLIEFRYISQKFPNHDVAAEMLGI